MLKIAVIGLGIIGGSIARSLKMTGEYIVDGWNRNHAVVETALQRAYIDSEVKNVEEYDVVFVALPPQTAMQYMDTARFRDGAIVADICGVKGVVEDFIYAKERNYRYVGTHPMAGKETRGLESSSESMFRGASMIITKNEFTDADAVETIKELSREMGFSRIVECSALYHDKKIALTSQLAHVVSNAYVKSPTVEGYEGFTGGSFQDMTRIAGVDETVWTQLYLYNRDNLLEELNTFISHLQVYREALQENSPQKLSAALKEGRLIRENIKSGKV